MEENLIFISHTVFRISSLGRELKNSFYSRNDILLLTSHGKGNKILEKLVVKNEMPYCVPCN